MTDIIDSVLRFKAEKINTAREVMVFRIKQMQEERLRLAKEEEEKRTANQSAENLADRIGTPSHKSEKVLEPQKSTADPSQKQLSRADFNKSTAEAF